jgi:5-methylthioadenosine/S-adenosylhomocysteine deaminase
VLPATEVIKMATINGARALGVDHQTGSLDIGKSADFIALDINNIESRPLYDTIAHVVWAADRHNVTGNLHYPIISYI